VFRRPFGPGWALVGDAGDHEDPLIAHGLTPPPPEMLQLFGALAGNQPDIDAFWGAIEGTVPVAEFFAPCNVERIVRAA